MYFGSIIYDEPYQQTYKGIEISDADTALQKIFSNDRNCPCLDYINLLEFLQEHHEGVRWSSNYDHFFMDGRKYVERYVTFNGDSSDPDKWEFVDEIEKIWNDEYDFRVIASSRIKTFQNFRRYIKKWKNK